MKSRFYGSAVRTLIFDFDGLIIDSESADFQSWKGIFETEGCDLTLDFWNRGIGTNGPEYSPFAELERQLKRPLDREAVRNRQWREFDELCGGLPLLPGVLGCLEAARARGLNIGLASSASYKERIIGHLERTGIHGYFSAIRCCQVGGDLKPKPHPDVYLAVMADMGVKPEEAVAFEDSPNGIRAAKAAGLFCVAVPNKMTMDLPMTQADMIIPSLEVAALELSR